MTKESETILSLLDLLEGQLPPEKLSSIRGYVEANEYGLGFEVMLELTLEHSIKVTDEFRQKAIWCGDQMRIDVAPYLVSEDP